MFVEYSCWKKASSKLIHTPALRFAGTPSFPHHGTSNKSRPRSPHIDDAAMTAAAAAAGSDGRENAGSAATEAVENQCQGSKDRERDGKK